MHVFQSRHINLFILNLEPRKFELPDHFPGLDALNVLHILHSSICQPCALSQLTGLHSKSNIVDAFLNGCGLACRWAGGGRTKETLDQTIGREPRLLSKRIGSITASYFA